MNLFPFFAENLAPSELKKIRNKLRKQRAKLDLERKQAQEKLEKRELHNKSRQQVAVSISKFAKIITGPCISYGF